MSNPKPSQGFHTNPERINKDGRPKAEWTWSGLLKETLEELDEATGLEKKHAVVQALYKQAKRGNIQAIKEYGDRIDGKAPQFVDHTTKGEKLPTPIYGGKSKV